jgi:pyrophosphatase PpaX
MKTYSAYLFDADGTLIDTIELIHQCFLYTCNKFAGRRVTKEEVVSQVGLPLKRSLQFFLGEMDEQKLLEVRNAHMQYQMSMYRDYLKVFPEVADVLRDLKKQNKKLGVVTSRLMETLGVYLKSTGIYQYFDVFITPENTVKHKPEPEPVLEALRLLGIKPNDALVVGDAGFDIESGNRAGADTAFVAWSHSSVDSLTTRPTYVINTLKELL